MTVKSVPLSGFQIVVLLFPYLSCQYDTCLFPKQRLITLPSLTKDEPEQHSTLGFSLERHPCKLPVPAVLLLYCLDCLLAPHWVPSGAVQYNKTPIFLLRWCLKMLKT